jgi:hypothetical protein
MPYIPCGVIGLIHADKLPTPRKTEVQGLYLPFSGGKIHDLKTPTGRAVKMQIYGVFH